MKKLFTSIYLLVLLNGCTLSMYTAELDALNSDGEPRKALLYWSKTDRLIGTSKAGPVILMTECSTRRLSFDETEARIIYRGEPGRDRIAGQNETIEDGTVCAKIETQLKLTELQAGELMLTMLCEAVYDEFSIQEGLYTPAYLKAREAPYLFDVQENTSWSLFGETPKAPEPPECK
ncbi:hypothetical protein [Methylotuvimicrobium buryatense]|uniref:Lipoprotein n=1 Tax=Methylotuvimicrobium buryatense TaxID=95641 RepID=A0A4V1IKB7_METBY|nr:hypothetical protein [Methylotuvimicrobium buryatense]QCW84345.1 hypothetical protein EQU24_20490 [Methylotuvimicrobium buryatense]